MCSRCAAWGHNVERDTVRLCEGVAPNAAYRRILLGIEAADKLVIIGRDLEAQVGMIVRLTDQARNRCKRKPLQKVSSTF